MGARVFMVAGGSRGIGEAVALAAAREGYTVLLSYVENAARADGVVERIRAEGGQAEAARADTGVEADVLALFEKADQLGRLEALVYNSGITGPASPLAEAETGVMARVLEVNLLGAMSLRPAARRSSGCRRVRGGSGRLHRAYLLTRRALRVSGRVRVRYAASKGGHGQPDGRPCARGRARGASA